MKTNYKAGFMAVLLIFTMKLTSAQNSSEEVPKALADILKFEGSWQGPATMTLEGKTYSFIYFADFKKTANGSGLTMDESFTIPELGSLVGANLIGYNSNDGNIHWFSVDNFGTTHEHIGNWISPGHFAMQVTEMQKGKKMVEKIDLVMKGNDQMDFSLVTSLDGAVFEKGNATFQRSKK
jgi:hypothetical protein